VGRLPGLDSADAQFGAQRTGPNLAGEPQDDGSDAKSDLMRHYLEKRANLVRFFAARLNSAAAAEDLAQELYLKIAALTAEDEIQNPSALLYRMGSNLMLDRLRQERRAGARESAWVSVATTRLGDEEIHDEPPADEVLAARQRLNLLLNELNALPPRMRHAFQLHKLEGLSHVETARAMGISVSAVEKHVSGALKTLLSRLG